MHCDVLPSSGKTGFSLLLRNTWWSVGFSGVKQAHAAHPTLNLLFRGFLTLQVLKGAWKFKRHRRKLLHQKGRGGLGSVLQSGSRTFSNRAQFSLLALFGKEQGFILARVGPWGNPVCRTHKQLPSSNEPDLGGYLKFQMSGQRKSEHVHNTEFNRELLPLGHCLQMGGVWQFFSIKCKMQLLFSYVIFPFRKTTGLLMLWNIVCMLNSLGGKERSVGPLNL